MRIQKAILPLHNRFLSCGWCFLTLAFLLALTPARSAADPLDAWSLHLPSTNGISGAPIFHYSISYGNDLFVVVGHHSGSDYGTIFTSPDGLSWTKRSEDPSPSFAPTNYA